MEQCFRIREKKTTEQPSPYFSGVTVLPMIFVFNLATGNRIFFCFTFDFGLPLISHSATKAHFVVFGVQLSLHSTAKDIITIFGFL